MEPMLYRVSVVIVENGYSLQIFKPITDETLHASVHQAPTALGRAVEKFFDGHRPPGIRPAMPPQDKPDWHEEPQGKPSLRERGGIASGVITDLFPAGGNGTVAETAYLNWSGELPRPSIREALYKTTDAAEIGDY